MYLEEWSGVFASEWTTDFVDPLLPGLGDTVRIRLRHPVEVSVDKVWFRPIVNGGDASLEMQRLKKGRRFAWWEISVRVEEHRYQYSFLFQVGPLNYYLTRAGVSRYPQTEDHDWVLFTDWDFPHWVPQSVFYQIFPDRFRKGNESLGVRTDEYTYGSGKTVRMSWDRPPLEWLQGRCLDFYNGDLEGIRRAIPYLKNLGVNALYLTPIFEARSTHRYDCTDYFHVDRHLGGDEALSQLVKDLHRAGMKIILDVSINHVGVEHPWVRRAMADKRNPERQMFYFRGNKPDGWCGSSTLIQLNFSSKVVQKQVWGRDGVVRHWLRKPFSIDGWRFDVGNFTARNRTDQLGNKVYRKIRKAVKKHHPQAYLLGEHWMDNITYLQGDQWDGAMNYLASSRAVRAFLGERDVFVHRAAHRPATVPPLTGPETAALISQHFNRIPNPLLQLQYNLIDSHDIARLYHNTETVSPSLFEAAVAFVFCLPGVPSLYYGDEIGLAGGLESVEQCRYPMVWNETAWNQERLDFYKDLIRLRRGSAALQRGAWAFLHAEDDALVLGRWLGTQAVLAVLNRCRQPRDLLIPHKGWGVVQATRWRTSLGLTVTDAGLSLELGPGEGAVVLCVLSE